MDSVFGTGFIAQKATLARRVVNLEGGEINHLRQWTGFYADTTARALLSLNVWTSSHQACTVQRRTQMFAALGKPRIGIVQRIHQPEDKTVERFLFGQTELLDYANIFSSKGPGW